MTLISKKPMTRLIAIAFLFLNIQSTTSLPTVVISSISMNIMTRSRVECSTFDERFNDEKEFKTLKGKRQVENFLDKLQTLEKFDDSKTDIDTRAQMIIKYSDHEEKICADKFAIYQNGTCYKITDDLKKLIWGS